LAIASPGKIAAVQHKYPITTIQEAVFLHFSCAVSRLFRQYARRSVLLDARKSGMKLAVPDRTLRIWPEAY
jgi:hypothetical protein